MGVYMCVARATMHALMMKGALVEKQLIFIISTTIVMVHMPAVPCSLVLHLHMHMQQVMPQLFISI